MKIKQILLSILLVLVFSINVSAYSIVRLGPEYFPQDTIGRPISNAQIYVGVPDLDPVIVGNQKQLSVQQEDGTIVAVAQPIRTSAGGIPLYLGSPVTLLVNGEYSLKVLSSSGSQVYYVPNMSISDSNYDYEVDALISYGNGINYTKATIDAALTAIGVVNPVTLLLRPGTWVINANADYSAYSNVNFKIPKGSIFAVSTLMTLTLPSPANIIAQPTQQIFSGAGTVVFSASGTRYPNWWQENTSPGTTDMSTAIHAAIAAGPAATKTVEFLEETYLMTTAVIVNDNRTHLLGKGKQSTIIKFEPVATATAFTFVRSGITNIGEDQVPSANTQLYQCSMKGFGFYSTNATVKTAIKLVNFSEFQLSDIASYSWTGVRSILLHTKGSAFLSANDLSLSAGGAGNGIPILIDIGPSYGGIGIDADHFNFNNIYLIAGDDYPCILGNAYGHWTNVSFTGHQAWVGGQEGLLRTLTGFTATGFGGTNSTLSINNVRTEQGFNAVAYSISLAYPGPVEITNAYLDSARNGIYLRNGTSSTRLHMANVAYIGGAGTTALNVDASILAVDWESCFWQAGTTLTLTGLNLRYGAKSSTNEAYSSAFYSAPYSAAATYISKDGTDLGYSTRYTWKGTIASGAQSPDITLASVIGGFIVSIVGLTTTPSIIGGQVIDYTSTTASVVPIKLSGTANFGVGNTAGSLTYFRAPGNISKVNLFNQSGLNVNVIMIIDQIKQ